MSKVQEYLDEIRKQILKYPFLEPYVSVVEERSKVNIEYFFLGLCGILVLMLFTGIGADIVCHIAAFVYPFYATLKALEHSNTEEKLFWLQYWVVYGILGFVENFVEILLYWIPIFYPLKFSFVVWSFLPQTRGAKLIYENALLPAFKKLDSELDAAVKSASVKKHE